jgi:hypothetical protein
MSDNSDSDVAEGPSAVKMPSNEEGKSKKVRTYTMSEKALKARTANMAKAREVRMNKTAEKKREEQEAREVMKQIVAEHKQQKKKKEPTPQPCEAILPSEEESESEESEDEESDSEESESDSSESEAEFVLKPAKKGQAKKTQQVAAKERRTSSSPGKASKEPKRSAILAEMAELKAQIAAMNAKKKKAPRATVNVTQPESKPKAISPEKAKSILGF